MSTQANQAVCEIISSLISQKKQAGYYNVPPPRLNIISPYPIYSKQQLDMRRKIEILKYTSAQQNTKQNTQTKKRQFADLVKNAGVSNSKISQYATNSGTNLICLSNLNKPISTTACDVPGPPMMLYYDPSVPLYNYGNYKNNRSFAVINVKLDAVYSSYTQNIVNFVSGNFYSLIADEIISKDIGAEYTYSGTIGSLVINGNPSNSVYNFNISTPVAVWFNSSIRSMQDIGVYYNDKQPLTIMDEVSLVIHIESIQVLVYYENKVVKSVTVMNDSKSTIFVDTICNLNTADSLFYAIQYVGMLKISNLTLDAPPQTTYTFKYLVKYSYNSKTANTYLDFIQSGVYTNLENASQDDYYGNCITTTSRAPVAFEPNSFTSFVVNPPPG